MRSGHRRFAVVMGASATVVVIALSVGAAYACTALSTLAVSRTSAIAGAPVILNGAGFTAKVPVVVRWSPASGTAQGPVLTSVMPSASGHFITTVKVPATAKPGEYVISTGQPAKPNLGTGAGALFEVSSPAPPPAASAASPHAPAAATPAAQGLPSTAGGPATWLLTLVSLFGALALVAVGLVLVRRRRSGDLPAGVEPASLVARAQVPPGATGSDALLLTGSPGPQAGTGSDPVAEEREPIGAGSSARFPS